MCVCTYKHVCIYVYICVYMYRYRGNNWMANRPRLKHICVSVFVRIYMHICMCALFTIQIATHMCMWEGERERERERRRVISLLNVLVFPIAIHVSYKNLLTYACSILACMHISIYACMHIYACIYSIWTYIYIYIHTSLSLYISRYICM